MIKTNDYQTPMKVCASMLSEEVLAVWRKTKVPYKDVKAVQRDVSRFLDVFLKAKPVKRSKPDFQVKIIKSILNICLSSKRYFTSANET